MWSVSREPFGASRQPLGGLLGAPGSLSRAAWGLLGLLGRPGAFQLRFRSDLEPSSGRLGAVLCNLEPSWVHRGGVLGPAWGHCGASCGRLESSLSALRAILETFLAFEDAFA